MLSVDYIFKESDQYIYLFSLKIKVFGFIKRLSDPAQPAVPRGVSGSRYPSVPGLQLHAPNTLP